jgi:hypothetical protein
MTSEKLRLLSQRTGFIFYIPMAESDRWSISGFSKNKATYPTFLLTLTPSSFTFGSEKKKNCDMMLTRNESVLRGRPWKRSFWELM